MTEWAKRDTCMVCGDQVEASDETNRWEHVIDNTDLCCCEDTHVGYVLHETREGLFSSQLIEVVPDVDRLFAAVIEAIDG